MIEFSFDKYKIAVQLAEPPDSYNLWLQYAKHIDTNDLNNDGVPVYVGVAKSGPNWYDDIIAFRTKPVDHGGFYPGFLIVAETDTLFIGAGKIVKTYDLKSHNEVFKKEFSAGFWGWERVGDFIIMSEELEFGVYSLSGIELWSTFVEPPWTYEIDKNTVKLNVMDVITFRNLTDGDLIIK